MPREYSPKQIEKYRRQKYIGALNKCTKNLFKIFRDKNISYFEYKDRFIKLKREIDSYSDIRLNSEYSKVTKEYIDKLFNNTVNSVDFDDKKFNDIRDIELTNLNRLQKLKNRTRYKKSKYKNLDSEFS